MSDDYIDNVIGPYDRSPAMKAAREKIAAVEREMAIFPHNADLCAKADYLNRRIAAAIDTDGMVRTEPLPVLHNVFSEGGVGEEYTVFLRGVVGERTPYGVEATMKEPPAILMRNPSMAGGVDPSSSTGLAIKALGEACASLFRLDDCAPCQTMNDFRADQRHRLADELVSLNYSPVLNYFLPRGLYQVLYEPTSDSFIFTFKVNANELAHRTTRDGLIFNRAGAGYWSTPIQLPMSFRVAAATSPGPVQAVTSFNCPSCVNLVDSNDHYCRHCAFDLTSLYPGVAQSQSARCPYCGFIYNGATCTRCGYDPRHPSPGSKNVHPPLNATGASNPAPTANGPTSASQMHTSIKLRCPGGCGSEIGIYGDQIGGSGGNNFVTSPCKYGCKVRVELWNKKVQEAKKR